MGTTVFRPQPPRVKNNDSQLEAENDACVVPEVALVVIARGEGAVEAGQHEIKLCRSDGNGFGQRDVDSSTNDEIKSIVARACNSRAAGLASLEQVSVNIRVGSAEQRLYEGLKVLRPIFQDGTDVVGK